MLEFSVYRQKSDYSFHEIAKTTYEEDARMIFNRARSAMITYNGVIIEKKNLTSEDTPELPIDYAAQP